MGHSSKDTSSKSGNRQQGGHHRDRKRAEDSHRSGQGSGEVPLAPKTIPKPPVGNSLSFLFVVNSLLISERAHIEADRYGIFPPPSYPNAYSEELPSPVFRYQDGRVTQLPANLYFWGREPGADGSYASGRIWGYSTDPFTNEYRAEKLTEYSTYTVFRGWHFQPVMFMGCDALTMNVDEEEMMTMYHPLSFGHDGHGSTVISRVNARGKLYAAGKHAEWVGKLVPDCYRNPYSGSSTYTSGGLAGYLAVILGLMGLSQPPQRAADAFTEGLWRNGRWRGPKWEFRPDTHNGPSPGPDDCPRGVLVQVCLDAIDNPYYSTAEAIQNWEDNGVIVCEPSSR